MFHKINLPAAWQVVTSLSLDTLKDIDEGEISDICKKKKSTWVICRTGHAKQNFGCPARDGRNVSVLLLHRMYKGRPVFKDRVWRGKSARVRPTASKLRGLWISPTTATTT